MQDSNYVRGRKLVSEEDKREVVQHLADMFGRSPNEQLRNLCEAHDWNVEKCIDQLMSGNNQNVNSNADAPATMNTRWNRNKLHGAIPKRNSASPQTPRNPLAQGKPARNHSSSNENHAKNSNNNNYMSSVAASSVEQRIINQIHAGSRVMVIMRGVPGSGKSYLAKSILERCALLDEQYTLKDFLYSTDDFFYDNAGRYKFCGAQLSDAHTRNHDRVRKRAAAGWSPIFVDNTNMQLWEMMPYVKIAVQSGYIIELLEPKTQWRNSARQLAMRNKHGVPMESIENMLDKYEKGTVGDLLKMLKETKYSVPLPQMRVHPPISVCHESVEAEEVFQIPQIASGDNSCDIPPAPPESRSNVHAWSHFKPNAPKAQRENSRVKICVPAANSWQPHEEERRHFWNVNTSSEIAKASKAVETSAEKSEKSLLDLLKEDIGDPSETMQKDDSLNRQPSFKRHSVNCPNENNAFASLRQIYPNKKISALWDLFVKCSGDIDWAVDLLLKEDELRIEPGEFSAPLTEEVDDFQCNCSSGESATASSSAPAAASVPLGPCVKPQRLRARVVRPNLHASSEIKEIIENRFKIGDEHYSPHLRNLREMREKLLTTPTKTYTDIEVQTDLVEEEQEDDEADEILEIVLGDELVQQLRSTFDAETTALGEQLPNNVTKNVFMPRSLAKELYMLWLESTYNQIEEQRQRIVRDDENFARLLKNPKYENYTQSPSNMQELLDMELAWMIYNSEEEKEQSNTAQKQLQPNDLAEYLTQIKLSEVFPSIPRETLAEVLSAHGNSYDETVKVLSTTMSATTDLTMEKIQGDLMERALREQELQTTMQFEQQQNDKSSTYTDGNGIKATPKPPTQPDDEKRMALHDFEETRNMAAHHCQLKAECYQKAKEAIQKGNSAVAVYYSQIANLHKMKIDMYNHRAANCIMDVHKYTQNNPELLDLHYLHVLEAIGCLDLFLDRHITRLRAASRTYKHVFIITGRGLHSAGGVSTIKNKVKTRLKERNLRWSEVNPGLLKVKIFSASRHSKNI